MNPFQEPQTKQPPPRCPSCEKKDRELIYVHDQVLKYTWAMQMQAQALQRRERKERQVKKLMREILRWAQ